MCGRMTITDPERVVAKFRPDVNKTTGNEPRYNVVPSQKLPAMIMGQGRRILGDLQWGLVPSWAKDPAIGNRMINARAETVAQKPSFRSAFKKRRCLIGSDGFYEWRRTSGAKQPYYIRVDDGVPFAFAGLYEIWKQGDGSKLSTCTIITTTPNEIMEPIHHRMPVILDEVAWTEWLDPENDARDALQKLLRPFDASRMSTTRISDYVNSTAHDDEKCIAAVT